VEVQVLWINALRAGAQLDPRWQKAADRAAATFAERFWCEEKGHLYDVVDVDHRAGTADAACRPNQILAVGGLPFPVLDGERARKVVDVVEARLWTPLGLRTLAQDEPGYVGHYHGTAEKRDAAYHQGVAWPWLLGPFAEAWVAVRGNSPEARGEARRRFLGPLLRHLDQAGMGHVSEIADGEEPFTPGGCPFQAWSLGEMLRLQLVVLSEQSRPRSA
jgi:glycogen debranching enzyme